MLAVIVVHQYGLFQPVDWGADCESELDRMRNLWNRLVEIERAHTAAVQEIGADDPVVKAATDKAESISNALKDVKERKKAVNKAARRNMPTAELDADIVRLRADSKAAWEQVKEARKAVRERQRDRLRALEEARKLSVKTARQTSGLFWGNYNAVIKSYDVARQRCIKTGAELRFRSFRQRDGRIVNQIQGGGTWDEVLAGTINGQLSIRPQDTNRVAGGRVRPIYNLTATVFTRGRGDRRTVTWPMVLHRPLPDDAQIQEVIISRRASTARRDKWTVSFLLRLPDAEPVKRNDATACGVDIGWRRLNDGIRVATVVDSEGERDFVVLPERIISGFDHAESLRSDIDTRLNFRVNAIRGLPWDTAPDALRDVSKRLRSSPKPTCGALAELVSLWPDTWQPVARFDASVTVRLNHRDLRERSGLVLRLGAARLDHYRCEAVRLVRAYRVIAIEGDLDIARMARRENSPLSEAARRNRVLASPGEFLSALKLAAAKHGTTMLEHIGKSSFVCSECGAEHRPSDPAELITTCPACSATWDQDVNAAKNILAGALASAGVTLDDLSALDACQEKENKESYWQRARRLSAENKSARADEDSSGD